ncbi:MAG: LamG-like jellyroll fold domain-containing protein [Aquirufa sp.]
MRAILLLFLLIPAMAKAQFFAPAYGNAVSKNNLMVDYDFSNANTYAGSGTTVNNLTGKSAPAYFYNSPAFIKDPGYLKFTSASAQYMVLGDFKTYYPATSSTTRSGVFTVSLWFNPTTLNGIVLTDLNSSTINGGYHTADIEMVNGYLKFSVWPRTSILTTASTVSLNTWHHVVLAYTGTDVKAYVDNIAVGTATYTREGPAMGTGSQYFGIAAYDITHMGSASYGNFLLADFKFYASALSAGEVSNLYNAEKTNYSLVFMLDPMYAASYPGSGSVWYDISGGNQSSTNTANVTYNTAAGGSMYFNGSGYSDFSFNLNGASTLTVELWAYPTSLTNGMFFGFYAYDVYLVSNLLGYNTSAGDLYGLNTTQTSGFANTWRHYVFVMREGGVTNNKIYVNGVLQSLAQQLGTPSNATAVFNAGAGRIGGWRINTNYTQQMYMSYFKIYNRELTQSEITNKFNASKTRHGY